MGRSVWLWAALLLVSGYAEEKARYRILVFSRTEGFRHASIEPGIAALKALGSAHRFEVVATEEAAYFHPDTLARYAAVVFLNTTGDVLDAMQEKAFEAYIRQGGGFVGIHAAADTEYDWPWYGRLVGAYFDSHPRVQPANVLATDRQHPATADLPLRWNHTDEWYNYHINPRAWVHVLAVVQESSYEGGAMGPDHPIAWAHEYEGGRSIYTGLGHTTESYREPYVMAHLYGAIEWAAGHRPGDVQATLASGYQEVVLTGELTDPMEIDITSDGRVFIVEWAGAIKIWEPDTNEMRVIGWLPVEKNIEDGLLGIALNPAFDENGWVYIYYSPVTEEQKLNRLSRFVYDGWQLDMSSEIAMLEIPVQRIQCCHSGGSVQFDKEGLLYLSTGDNSGGNRDHEDPHYRRLADQGRTSANSNDLRGKILRIRPEPDGTYSIPEGNLFKADSLHRGEIWSMGHRNPFRISIDDSTGWVYWGDVGPGLEHGWDEFNQAQGPGFYGWPLFTGYNDVYPDYRIGGQPHVAPDPDRPVNDSPHNTGVRELPPAQPAWIRYFYGMSEEYPELGAGGLNPMAGPTFHFDASTAYPTALPPYYDNKVMIYEWMRNWVQVVTLNPDGSVLKMDPFLPGNDYIRPMDIEVGPHGHLYILEWGDEFWGSNPNAQLVRLDYYGSNPGRPAPPAVSPPGRPVMVAWPPNGGIFDFNGAIAYTAEVEDQALADQVSVQIYTGFDTSPIPLEKLEGLAGKFTVSKDFTHHPDIHYADRFAVVEACLERACSQVKLQPRLKEAEHVFSAEESTRKTYSARPASEHWGRTALSVMPVENGSVLAYGPVNLYGITGLTLRFRATEDGQVSVTAPGLELAVIDVGPEAGEAVTPHQADYLASVPADAPGLGLLEEGAYDNWREISVDLAEFEGSFTLTLGFASEAERIFLELDWIRFDGPGIMQ